MNKSSKHATRVLLAVFATCTVGQKLAIAAPETNSHQEQTLVVFDCDSRYVKINSISGTVQATGTYPTFPDASARFDGCLINDVLDTNTGALYALMPQSHSDDGQAQSYAVVGLDEKDLKVLKRYDLPEKQTIHPNLIYDPIQQDLVIVFDDGLSLQRLGIASGSNLNPGPIVKLQQPLLNPHVDSVGNIIGEKTVFDSAGHVVQQVRPELIFDANLKEKFSRETLVKGSTEHYYGAIQEAAAAGRIIFTLAGDSESEHSPSSAIIVYDTRLKRAVSSFSSPFPVAQVFAGHGTLHVSPNGHRIVLEQYEWLADDVKQSMPSDAPNRKVIARTGTISVYNADTGSHVGNVTLEKSVHQEARAFINFSSDGQYMFYWFDKHLYVIDAEKAQLVSKLTLPDKWDPDAIVARPMSNRSK